MRSRAPLRLLGKILGQTPELIPRIASGLFRKHVQADWDYRRGDGRASGPPVMITLRITNACNQRCAVCGQYGRRGYMNADPGPELLRVLPVETYERLLDEVAPLKPVINITGGEPFLYPGLMELGNRAKQRGLTVLVTTNGVRLAECAQEIVDNRWDVVLVSLDGPEAVHDACRGSSGAFRAAHDGLAALRRHTRASGASKPYVNTSTTLSSVNVKCLTETFEIGRELAPDLMVIFLSWFTSQAMGQLQTEIMKQELGIDPQAWKSYVRTFAPAEAAEFQSALIALKKKRWPFDYFIVPEVGDENYARYYLELESCFGYSKCAAPFIMTDILSNGDVVTCRDYVDVTVGNIEKTPFMEIWNGEPYKAYRRMMIRHRGLLPQCARCCGLMGF